MTGDGVTLAAYESVATKQHAMLYLVARNFGRGAIWSLGLYGRVGNGAAVPGTVAAIVSQPTIACWYIDRCHSKGYAPGEIELRRSCDGIAIRADLVDGGSSKHSFIFLVLLCNCLVVGSHRVLRESPW